MQLTRLTQTVQKGGCAAKVSAEELREILKRVPMPKRHEALRVDGGTFDDAAIYEVSPEIALVQTLDFFTPIVDSPRLFGAISAANALSDVYAMGGEPKTAMAILAFPLANFSQDIIVEVLSGAAEKIAESGACLVGGHSIDDDTLKFGLSVTGFVHPKKVWTNAGAKKGDKFILTKPLGTGAVTSALKRSAIAEENMNEVLHSMAQLNRINHLLNSEQLAAIHAATDITGFGLTGHSKQLAQASHIGIKFDLSSIPYFSQLKSLLSDGFLTKAHRTNDQYTSGSILSVDGLSKLDRLMINDPQTSGGLLLSVRADRATDILESLKKEFLNAAIIGEATEGSEKCLCFQ